MTTELKGYPFEVVFSDGKSAVLADQVKCLDWRMRNAQSAKRVAPDAVIRRVRELLHVLLQI